MNLEKSNYSEIVDQVNEGNLNALEMFIAIKRECEAASAAMDALKQQAIDEAAKYGGKSFEAFGAKIERRNAPSRWNYKGISSIEDAEKKVKQLQTIAQVGGVDPDTGEVMKAVKIEGGETIAISFIK